MPQVDAEQLRRDFYEIAAKQEKIKFDQDRYQRFLDSPISYEGLLPFLEEISTIIQAELNKLANFGDIEIPFNQLLANFQNAGLSLAAGLEQIGHTSKKLRPEHLIDDKSFLVGTRILRTIIPALNHPSIARNHESRMQFAINVLFRNTMMRMIHQWILDGSMSIGNGMPVSLHLKQQKSFSNASNEHADDDIDLTLPRLPKTNEDTKEMEYPLPLIEGLDDPEITQQANTFDPDETQASPTIHDQSSRIKN